MTKKSGDEDYLDDILGGTVKPRQPPRRFKLKRMPLPINCVNGRAEAIPQLPFRPTALFIPEDVGKIINVHDVRVGMNLQAVAAGPMPGEFFSMPIKAIRILLDLGAKLPFLTTRSEGAPPVGPETDALLAECDRIASMVEAMTWPIDWDTCSAGYSIAFSYTVKDHLIREAARKSKLLPHHPLRP